jgi:hypothetical protein
MCESAVRHHRAINSANIAVWNDNHVSFRKLFAAFIAQWLHTARSHERQLGSALLPRVSSLRPKLVPVVAPSWHGSTALDSAVAESSVGEIR